MTASFVEIFRASAPYLHAHRGRTFVIAFGGEVVQSGGLALLVHDIAMLHGLGIRLVLVSGARPQIERALKDMGKKSRYANGMRVTDEIALACVRRAVGSVRVELEARFTMGLPNTPMAGAKVRLTTGNFVTAQPIGVIDGIDLGQTGRVRRVDASAIRAQLDAGNIVLLTPVGYSLTGEIFNVAAQDVAARTAVALGASKMISLVEGRGILSKGRVIQQLHWPDAQRLLRRRRFPDDLRSYLAASIDACRNGVERSHIVPRKVDGGLLLELFTRDGLGTLVTSTAFENVRDAKPRDVGGIRELIDPLEHEGMLRRRSREMLEADIDHFVVIERDGLVEACAALYEYPQVRFAELACVAVHPSSRGKGFGDIMLEYVERSCRAQRIDRLFVLTTQAVHWFLERGFQRARLRDLPKEAREHYVPSRRSKVLIKHIEDVPPEIESSPPPLEPMLDSEVPPEPLDET